MKINKKPGYFKRTYKIRKGRKRKEEVIKRHGEWPKKVLNKRKFSGLKFQMINKGRQTPWTSCGQNHF